MKTKKALSVKERIAALKAAKAKTTEKTTTNKKGKKEKTTSERGRPSGVVYTVDKDYQQAIEDQMLNISNKLDVAKMNAIKFKEKGNKTAAMETRKALQEITKISKELRAVIQEAKANIKKEKAA